MWREKGILNVQCWFVEGLEVVDFNCKSVSGSYVKIRVDSDGGFVEGNYLLDCCPTKNNILGECDSSTNTCVWSPCKTNADCEDDYCCVTSSQDSNVTN